MGQIDAGVASVIRQTREGPQAISGSAVSVASASALGRRAATGAFWVLIAVIATRALGVGADIVLARLLSPEDFGLVRFALTLIGAFTILQDLGVPASIIHSDRKIEDIGGTALAINVAAATVLFIVASLLSPFVAAFAREKGVAPIVVVLAFGLIASALGSVQRALLIKELAFRRKFVPDIVPLVISGVVSIALALLGFGAWSLVFGNLAQVTTSTILLWLLTSVRPRPEFRLSVARELLGYGVHVSFVSIIGFIGVNTDYFIVGHYLGAFELGIYSLSFILTDIPNQAIGQVVRDVTFPMYSRLRHDAEILIRAYSDVLSILSTLSIAVAIGIFICGPVYVPILLGQKWAAAGVTLQILTVHMALRTSSAGFSPLYKAIGRARLEWELNIVRIVILIPLMILLVNLAGLPGIGIAYVVVALLFVPANMIRLSRPLGLSGRRSLLLLAPQLAGAAMASLLIVAWSAAEPALPSATAPLGAALLTLVANSAFLGTVVVLNPRLIVYVRTGISWLVKF